MSLAELMPTIDSLSGSEKYNLAVKLLAEMPELSTVHLGEFPVYTPEFEPSAAAIMMKVLEQDRLERASNV